MKNKDAVKARIQTLNGELVALVQKLRNFQDEKQASAANLSQSFARYSAKKNLRESFSHVCFMESFIKRQIDRLQKEIDSLCGFHAQHQHFRLTA